VVELPTFSIVIAAHNAARTLPATIRSVLSQTRRDFEIVVVDDGSVDDTERALRRTTDDSRVVYLRQQNLGPAAARNTGIERSRGEYVCLLDSDDLWLPGYLQGMADALADDPTAALAYTDAWRLDDETRRIFRRTIMASQKPPVPPPTDPEALFGALLERNFVYTSTTIRRSTLGEVGGFRTLTRSEDYELWLRMAASGMHFVRTARVLAVYRDRPGSRIHDPRAMLRGRREIYEHILATYPLTAESRARAERRLEATTEQLAALEDAGGGNRRTSSATNFLRARLVYRLRPPREIARAFHDLGAV
jgi:glycosyltransferase involved in cell wall biosynthesis